MNRTMHRLYIATAVTAMGMFAVVAALLPLSWYHA